MFRSGGDVGKQGGGRRGEERWVVVLSDCENVQANFVGLLGDLYDRLDAFSLTRGVTGDWISGDVADGEDSELHCYSLSLNSLPNKRLCCGLYSFSVSERAVSFRAS